MKKNQPSKAIIKEAVKKERERIIQSAYDSGAVILHPNGWAYTAQTFFAEWWQALRRPQEGK